jgi:hypothetical protein
MKNRAIIVLSVLLMAGSCFSYALAGTDGNLYSRFYRSSSVKVFVDTPVNSTDNKILDNEKLREYIQEIFAGRKSISFKVVNSEKEADIVVRCEVIECSWSETDPVDMLIGVGPAVMDAATNEPYSLMLANVTINDAKRNQTIWTKRVKASVTKQDMDDKEGVILAGKKLAKTLMRDAFGKNR